MVVSRVFFKGFSRVFQEVSRAFQLSLEGVSRGISRTFKGCFMEVSMLFPKCLKEVSRQFSRCFKVVSCCMALIAATRAEGWLVTIQHNSQIFSKLSMIAPFSGNGDRI